MLPTLIQKAVEIAKKEKVLKKGTCLKKINILNIKTTNRFQIFLIESRLRPFLTLKVLLHLCEDEEFIIGCEEFITTENDFDEEDSGTKYGPIIIKQKYSAEQIKDMLLENLGFTALDTNPPHLLNKELKSDQGTVNPLFKEHSDNHIEKKMFLSTDGRVILTEDAIYAAEEYEEIIKGLIKMHTDEFKKFLEKYKDSHIPHQVYIDWLLKLFPGKIKIKRIQ